jgi:DNA-binding MarR family transcriptional regulator
MFLRSRSDRQPDPVSRLLGPEIIDWAVIAEATYGVAPTSDPPPASSQARAGLASAAAEPRSAAGPAGAEGQAPRPVAPASALPRRKPPRFYEADSLLAEDSVGLLMKQCVAGLGRELQERIDSHAVTYAQWPALAALSRRQSRTAAELARELQMDAGAMTRMLDRLEEKGLITRNGDPADRRVTLIELTAEGARAVAPIRAVLADVLNEALRGFTAEEFDQFRGYLRRVHGNVARCRQGDCDSPPAGDPA